MRRKNHYERNYTNHKNRSKDSRLLRRIIVKPKKVTRRAQAYGLILVMLCMILANPATVMADNVSVPSSGSASQEVTATFSIDDDTLSNLGYGVIASIPISMPLSFNSSTKVFSNSAAVYCSGVLPSGKKVSVTVNESAEKYGKVFDSENESTSVKSKTGFDISLSKTDWSKSECYENLSKINASQDATQTGNLTVAIPGNGFIPKGAGTFSTYVPLIISQSDED